MDLPPYYSGQLLLALPGMADPRFARSIVAICAHDAEGALGIDIGTPVRDMSLHLLLAHLDIAPGEAPDAPVMLGGPVEPQRGFVLHSLDWGGQDMLQVGNRWGLSGSLDVLKAIAKGKGPARWIAALGYSGWGGGQLEQEIVQHSWHLAEPSERILFDVPPGERWSAAYRAQGVDPALLASQSGNA